jgi:hypothetical protein
MPEMNNSATSETKKTSAIINQDSEILIVDKLRELAERDEPKEIREVLYGLLQKPIWKTRGVIPLEDAPIGAGGYNWIVKVKYNGKDCALSVPKFLLTDVYDERSKVRKKLSDLVPKDIFFLVPRILKTYSEPFPTCLMTFMPGVNCYQYTFNKDQSPKVFDGTAPISSEDVFYNLGKMAQTYSQITNNLYGVINNPSFNTATEYIEDCISKISVLFTDNLIDYNKYGFTRNDIDLIISWVREDSKESDLSFLVHDDLSPWNMHYEQGAKQYSMTDGDGAKYGLWGEQLGVCLMSMRGNENHAWVKSILDGFGLTQQNARNEMLIKACAYGAITYGLKCAAEAVGQHQVETRNLQLNFVAPLIRIFTTTLALL